MANLRISIGPDFYEQTPDGNALATEAVMNTIRTADLLFGRIGRLLRPLGVSAAGGLVLGMLRDRGAMTPSALGERLIVTRATITGVVDSLERAGFVRRSPSDVDRRSTVIELTEAGRDAVQQVREIIHRSEKEWFSSLTDDELRGYIADLHRVQDALAGTESEP